MPDKILSQDQLNQLDSNIRKMIDNGLGREDVDLYAKQFKEKFGKISGQMPASAPAIGKELETFQQQEVVNQPESKYDRAVKDDRSRVGKLAATIYNGLVGAAESMGGFVGEVMGTLATKIPSPQYDIGGNKLGPTIYDLSPEQQQKAKKVLKTGIKEGIGKLRSDYVTREEEKNIQGKLDVTNGIGLDDFEGLAAMSGRIIGDLGLASVTGGSSYFMQAYSDGVDDYDEASAKMGVEPNPYARAMYGTATGTINGLLEKYAIDKLVGSGPVFKSIQKKVVANVLKNTSTMSGKAAIDAIENVAKEEIKNLTKDLKSRGLKIGYRALVEGGTEGAQAALEDGAKLATNWAQGVDTFNEQEVKDQFFKNVLNSAAAGVAFGPVIGFGASKMFGEKINTQVLDDIANAKTQEDLDRINQELQVTFDKNNFNEAERQLVMDNARRYAEVKQTLPTETSPAAQIVAIPKIEDRIKLDNEIKAKQAELSSIDESLKPSYEQDISILQDKRSSLNDEIREVVTGEKFDYTEENGKFYKVLPDGNKEEISRNRYDLEQLKIEDNATTKGQGPIQKSGTEGDISQYQGTQGEQEQATAKTDSRYRNIVSEEAVGIPSFLGMTVTYKLPNRKITGTLIQEGQTISVEDENGDVVAEIGNIDELSNMSPEQMNLTVIEPNVEITEKGFAVDGKELLNENENPFDAVSIDKNGNVMNVVLTTSAGKRRKFRGRVAQKLATQISQKEDQRLKAEDEQLQKKFAVTPPKAPVVITTQPAIAKITEDNIDEIDNIQATPLQKKVFNDVKNVVKAVGAAVKNITGSPVSVNIHNTKSYTDAVIEAGGTQEDAASRGFYMADDGSIHLNSEALDSDTMLHEGFHPILDILEKYNPQVINDLFTQLESIPEAADIIAQAKEKYDGDITQKKEAITDFVAGVADGRIVLNPSNFQKIKKFIIDMLNKIGIGGGGSELMNVNSEQDLVKLAKFVTEKFTTGEQITLEQLDKVTSKKGVMGEEQKGVQFQKTPTKTEKSTKKRFFKDQFLVGGLLGSEILNLKEQMAGELSDEMTKAQNASKKAMDLIKKYSSVVTQQDVEDFLTGKPNANRQIPMDLAATLSEMRAHVDNLTDRLINLGVIDDPEEIAKYQANKGKYLLRSYEIFNAQPTAMEKMLLGKSKTRIDIDNVVKKLKNVDQAKVDRALKFLEKEIAKSDPTLSPEQVKEKAIAEANKILADTDSKFAPKKFIGSTNVKSLEERIDIAPAIRALMGEYTDPIYNYYASIFKLAALTSNRKFLNDLKEEGMGKFLFKEATPEATVQVSSEKSEALKPLAGLYTFPEIKEALEEQEKMQTNIAYKFLGWTRKLKTVYNPATHVKNIIGNSGFFISNGHWNYLDEAWKLAKNNPKEFQELMSVLRRQGVLNSSVGIGELRSYFDKHASIDEFLETTFKKAEAKSLKGKTKEQIEKIKRGSLKVTKSIEDAYQMEDDIFKIVAFVNESNRYAKAMFKESYANLTPEQKQEVDLQSSKIVKNTYPTFSRAPKFVKSISKNLLLGNFLTFPVESVRVSYNTLKLAKDEINSGNPDLRRVGMSRLIGTLAYNGLFSTLSYYMSMAGVGIGGMLGAMFDDEDEKKKREKIDLLRAPWTNNSEIIPIKFSDGKLIYVDIGSLDSYSYQKKVWSAFWDNINDEEGFKKAAFAATKQLIDPYLTLDFTYQTFKDLYDNNDESTGRKIYNPESEGYQDKVIDVSAFLAKKLGPGVIGSAMKMYRFYNEGDAEKLNSEIQSQIVRTYNTDVEKQFARYLYADRAEGNDMTDVGFKERLDDAKSLYTSIKNQKGVSQQEIDASYASAIKAYKNVLSDVSKYYQAALYSGVPQENLMKILYRAKLGYKKGPAEIYSIMKGVADLPDQVYIIK